MPTGAILLNVDRNTYKTTEKTLQEEIEMFVADKYQVIKNREGLKDVDYAMVEVLDQMLNDNGIQHFFSLPEGDDDGIQIRDEEVTYVYYDSSKNDLEFELVYMLWAKTIREVPDDKIKEAMKRICK